MVATAPGDAGAGCGTAAWLRRRHLPLLAALAAPWLAAWPAAAARARVGEVDAVTGAAVALFSGEPPRSLAPAAPVLIEDLLATGLAARLACRLEGGIELRLGESASLRVDALTLRGPQAGVALRSFGGPLLYDGPSHGATAGAAVPVSLTLPWARIGVRGTRFFAGPLDGRLAVFVARGRVEVTAAGAGAVLAEGEGVDIAETGAPGPVTRWGPARIARAMALVEQR